MCSHLTQHASSSAAPYETAEENQVEQQNSFDQKLPGDPPGDKGPGTLLSNDVCVFFFNLCVSICVRSWFEAVDKISKFGVDLGSLRGDSSSFGIVLAYVLQSPPSLDLLNKKHLRSDQGGLEIDMLTTEIPPQKKNKNQRQTVTASICLCFYFKTSSRMSLSLLVSLPLPLSLSLLVSLSLSLLVSLSLDSMRTGHGLQSPENRTNRGRGSSTYTN